MNNEKKFIKLTPFKMQVLQSFPFIDADFDAITNYELLCKVVEYLNTTVDNVNLLNDKVEEFEQYFDNLDVQEEINNKLDEMAESGQLADIIAQYLGLAGVLAFNTVNDMKSATNLVSGSTVNTLGYYELNDGGSASYKIREVENTDIVDNMLIIPLVNSNLVAELIIKNIVNPKQLGAYGDDIHDDSTVLNKVLSLPYNVIFNYGTYKIDTPITLSGKEKTFDLTNSTINYSGNEEAIIITKLTNSDVRLGKIISPVNGIVFKSNIGFSDTPNKDDVQYVNLFFHEIQAGINENNYAILINPTGDGWVNQVNICNGEISIGYNGIKILSQSSNPVNGINLYNIGFESTNANGASITIDSDTGDYVYDTKIINPRYTEKPTTTLLKLENKVRELLLIGEGELNPNRIIKSNNSFNIKIMAPIVDGNGYIGNGIWIDMSNNIRYLTEFSTDNYTNLQDLSRKSEATATNVNGSGSVVYQKRGRTIVVYFSNIQANGDGRFAQLTTDGYKPSRNVDGLLISNDNLAIARFQITASGNINIYNVDTTKTYLGEATFQLPQ